MDPVVIAFMRGMVMVGDVAWAVKGIAEPDRMRLNDSIINMSSTVSETWATSEKTENQNLVHIQSHYSREPLG